MWLLTENNDWEGEKYTVAIDCDDALQESLLVRLTDAEPDMFWVKETTYSDEELRTFDRMYLNLVDDEGYFPAFEIMKFKEPLEDLLALTDEELVDKAYKRGLFD